MGFISAMGIERLGLGSQEILGEDTRRRALSNVEPGADAGASAVSWRNKNDVSGFRYCAVGQVVVWA